MKKRIYRLAPCADYDMEHCESWLQDMAKEGWFLHPDSFIFGFAAFEAGTPSSTMRYRLEASAEKRSLWDDNNGYPDDEARSLAEDMGWNYVCSRGQFHIYSCNDPHAPELNTDTEVQALTLKILRKRMRDSFFNTVFWMVCYPLLRSMGNFVSFLTLLGPFALLVAFLLIPLELAQSILALRYLRKLQKRLESGEQPQRKKDWRSHAKPYWFGKILNLLSLVAFFYFIFSAAGDNLLGTYQQSLKEYKEPLPFSTIEDMAEGEFRYDDFGDWSNQIEVRSNWLAPSIIELHQTAQVKMADGSLLDGGLNITYFDCRWNWMAESLAKERQLYDKRRSSKHYQLLELPDYDVDYAIAYNDIFPTVILVEDNRMLRVSFYQTSSNYTMPLEEWVPIFIKDIKQ